MILRLGDRSVFVRLSGESTPRGTLALSLRLIGPLPFKYLWGRARARIVFLKRRAIIDGSGARRRRCAPRAIGRGGYAATRENEGRKKRRNGGEPRGRASTSRGGRRRRRRWQYGTRVRARARDRSPERTPRRMTGNDNSPVVKHQRGRVVEQQRGSRAPTEPGSLRSRGSNDPIGPHGCRCSLAAAASPMRNLLSLPPLVVHRLAHWPSARCKLGRRLWAPPRGRGRRRRTPCVLALGTTSPCASHRLARVCPL